MTYRMKDILNDPNKCVSKAESLLTRLWRQILLDLQIGPKNFDACVNRYLRDPNTGIADNPTARNNHRGNLMKELASETMTWKGLSKGLQVVGVEKYEVVINIQRRDGNITSHGILAQNNIVYPDDQIDLTKANVISEFQFAAQADAEEEEVTQITPIVGIKNVV